MKLQVLIRDSVAETERYDIFEIDPTDSVAKAFTGNEQIFSAIIFPDYYLMAEDDMLFRYQLPYIIRNSEFVWHAPMNRVTVQDFLNTHEINPDTDTIHFETGFPAAGGIGLPELELFWEVLPQILQGMEYIVTVASFSALIAATVKRIKKKFMPKEIPSPPDFFCAIYSKNKWNYHELASMLQIKPDEAKQWLTVLKYEWDNSEKLYSIDKDEKRKNIEKLNSIRLDEVFERIEGLPPK